MRLLKTIIFFALLAYAVMFCLENLQRLSITVPFIANIESVPLFIVIIVSVIFGILLGHFIGTGKRIRKFFTENSSKKENRLLKDRIELYETEERIRKNAELQSGITPTLESDNILP